MEERNKVKVVFTKSVDHYVELETMMVIPDWISKWA